MRELALYWGEQLAADLTDDAGLVRMQYDLEYLDSGSAQQLSLSLPLAKEMIEPPRPANFIANLLPEGRIRELMSRSHRIDENDDVALIERIGSECAGALTVLPKGATPSPTAPQYEPLSQHELGEYITQFQSRPVAPFRGAPIRLSLAGAQSKSAIALFNGEPHQVIHGASTHIIKPPPLANAGAPDPYPDVVLNEFICSKLAAACKLPIPDVQLLPFTTYRGGTPMHALCIERFDRLLTEHGVERLHQEDFCQALGVPPGRKYEQDDGVTLAQMLELVRSAQAVSTPAAAFTQFLRHFLFNLLIGNADAHAKNYALLYTKSGRELAPAYDLVSTMAYEQLDRGLPQTIGDCRRIDELTAASLVDGLTAAGIKPQAIHRAVQALSRSLDAALQIDPTQWLDTDADPELKEALRTIHEQLSTIIRQQCERLRS